MRFSGDSSVIQTWSKAFGLEEESHRAHRLRDPHRQMRKMLSNREKCQSNLSTGRALQVLETLGTFSPWNRIPFPRRVYGVPYAAGTAADIVRTRRGF